MLYDEGIPTHGKITKITKDSSAYLIGSTITVYYIKYTFTSPYGIELSGEQPLRGYIFTNNNEASLVGRPVVVIYKNSENFTLA